jgi:fumarate reductase flavoprotein subunit
MLVYHLTAGNGAAVIRALAEECKRLGIPVLTSTPAKRLLVGKKGNVTGVVAEADGKEFTITAKGVIIAAGGWNGNKDLLKRYYPNWRGFDGNMENVHAEGMLNNGDGLLMAKEIGAATIGLAKKPRRRAGALPGPGPRIVMNIGSGDDTFALPVVCVSSDSSVIWINDKGLRFCDENYLCTHHPACEGITTQDLHKASFAFFDQGIVDSFTKNGLSIGYLHIAPKGTPLPGFERELRKKADEGELMISDSLDDIAKWMGADPKVLKATIEEYNADCDRGYDPIFAKDKRYMVPFRTPPYYVIGRNPAMAKGGSTFLAAKDAPSAPMFMAPLDTSGGVKVNERMEVLNKKDKPIPGLYAAGTTTGGWEINWDDSMNSGNPASFAINSGRIAAESAMAYISGLK